jgi:hypothetical protein
MNNKFKLPKLSKLNGVPQSFEGKFFGLPFKLINQYTIDNKVEILFYDNRPKGEIVAIIKDNSKLDNLIDSVAVWLFNEPQITNLTSYHEEDLKEVHKRLKPFLSNLLQEVKKYNKKPKTVKTKAIKPVKKTKATVKKATVKKATVKKATVKKTRQKITTSNKQTGTSNLIYDKRKKAKAPGKRKSASGKTYYEYRRNRSDIEGFDTPARLNGLFFQTGEISTLDDLKKAYKNLAKKLHPDKGGDTAKFQAMQNEYDLLVNEILKTGNLNTQQVKNEVELDEIFKQIVNALIPYENLNIEIIGTWIWLSGTFNDLAPLTKKYGNGLLDSLGFKWASNKKMYYLDTTGKGTKNKKEMSIDSIRNKYGSQTIKSGKAKLNGVEDKKLIALFRKLKLKLKKRKTYLNKI